MTIDTRRPELGEWLARGLGMCGRAATGHRSTVVPRFAADLRMGWAISCWARCRSGRWNRITTFGSSSRNPVACCPIGT